MKRWDVCDKMLRAAAASSWAIERKEKAEKRDSENDRGREDRKIGEERKEGREGERT